MVIKNHTASPRILIFTMFSGIQYINITFLSGTVSIAYLLMFLSLLLSFYSLFCYHSYIQSYTMDFLDEVLQFFYFMMKFYSLLNKFDKYVIHSYLTTAI